MIVGDDGDGVGVMYDPSTPQPKPQVMMMMLHEWCMDDGAWILLLDNWGWWTTDAELMLMDN